MCGYCDVLVEFLCVCGGVCGLYGCDCCDGCGIGVVVCV